VRVKNVVITEADFTRLQLLLESTRRFRLGDTEHFDILEEELARATVVSSGMIRPNVVTMNSRVRVKDLNSGHELIYQIVFPKDADVARNRISILAPIGTALLGFGAGCTIELKAPSGMRRFRILNVEYQPEAAGVAA